MTKARNIANLASDGSALADGTINYTDVSGTPTLATVATSGAYADVSGTPTLATVATSGAYADVTGTPTLATVATSGAYADVTGTPAAALPLTGGTLSGGLNVTSGNVGIGTSSPTHKLTVGGYSNVDAANKLAIGDNADYQALIYMESANETLTIENTSDYAGRATIFKDNGSERCRIDSSGNVLVGRSSNLSDARTLITGTKSGTGGTNGQLVILDQQGWSTTDNGGGISFAGEFYDGGQVVFSTIQGVKANNTDANNAGDLVFSTRPNGGNVTERMRISSTGVISGDGSGLTGVSPPTTYGAVGTYAFVGIYETGSATTASGTTYAASSLFTWGLHLGGSHPAQSTNSTNEAGVNMSGLSITNSALSGTWRVMNPSQYNIGLRAKFFLAVRIS